MHEDLGVVIGPLFGHDREPESRPALADESRIGADLVAFQSFDRADDLEGLVAGLADGRAFGQDRR